jgi:hypothetical protein
MNRNAIGHVATMLVHAIGTLARIASDDREKPIVIIEAVRATDWASLTFVGQRHELDLRIEGPCEAVDSALARIEAGIADAEIAIRGHFIAEIGVVPGRTAPAPQAGHVGRCLRIEALVLND